MSARGGGCPPAKPEAPRRHFSALRRRGIRRDPARDQGGRIVCHRGSPSGSRSQPRHSSRGSDKGIITVSIGVATFVWGGAIERTEQLIRRADEALYGAKSSGRDRVHGGPPRLTTDARTPSAGRLDRGAAIATRHSRAPLRCGDNQARRGSAMSEPRPLRAP